MNIYVMKLVTGEEIIGTSEVKIEKDDRYINFSDVYRINTVMDKADLISTLIPFMVYCNSLFTFDMRNVIVYSIPTPQAIEFYDETLKLDNSSGAEIEYPHNKTLN